MAVHGNVGTVIVWEFQADIPGMFTPFADKVSNYIEDQYTKDINTKVELDKIEPTLKDYALDLVSMLQTRKRTGNQRKIRRQLFNTSSTIGNGIVWEWLTDVGWVTYDADTIDAIEDAFTKNQEELDLATLKYRLPNIVLIKKGYQKNKNTQFVRPIQRRAVSYKSTAPPPVAEKPTRKRANNQIPSHPLIPSLYSSSSQPSTNHAQSSVSFNGHSSATPVNSQSSATLGGPSESKTKVNSQQQQKTDQNSIVFTYCKLLRDAPPPDEDCAICLIPLQEDSEDDSTVEEDPVVQLLKCKHSYHMSCMEAYCKQGNQNGCIQCPICKKIHGIKRGNQPPGTMNYSTNMRQSVAGYEGCGMITITYNISSGIQGADGPNPGSNYTAYGFPRTCYLPANEKGKKILELLKIAWERKLIFTIDTSTTTGMKNSVVWNEIHHKTSPSNNNSGHGFPDPKYLDNVLEELKQHGVTDED